MVDYERLAGWAGVGVPIWTLGTILLATTLSPSFAWTGNALSNLGAETDVSTPLTILLFNGGLIIGGLVGVAFAVAIDRRREHVLERAGAVVLALCLLALAGVGVFPQGESLHFPMAAGHYLLFTVAFWLYGAGNVVVGERTRGVATIVLGIVHLAGWYVWLQAGGLDQGGLAIPEIYGAIIFSGWVLVTAQWHLFGDRTL